MHIAWEKQKNASLNAYYYMYPYIQSDGERDVCTKKARIDATAIHRSCQGQPDLHNAYTK